MPLFNYRCSGCGSERETFKKSPQCCGQSMQKLLSKPSVKFMEPRGPEAKERGKSVLKNQDRILRERTRNHNRDVDMHGLIQSNPPEVSQQSGWLNEKGEKRRKIDDI